MLIRYAILSTPINADINEMDIDSAEATRIQPSREQLQPRFLTEFNVDESDLTENEQETRVAPNQATEMLPIIQVCKKLFTDSCLCIKHLFSKGVVTITRSFRH